MRKKIIFLDVDGTLTDYENHIPASAAEAIRKARANGRLAISSSSQFTSAEAIRKARANGHRVYLCTGRSRAEIYDELWAIGLDGMIGGSIADTIAFGDAIVDVPMLRTCAIGVAMGSGGEQARMAADHVTDDVKRDGLAKAFVHFGLI